MNKKINTTEKIIKYSEKLIIKIKELDYFITEDIHSDVINFCTIVLSDNPSIYKKINKNFYKELRVIKLKIIDYSTSNYKEMTQQDTNRIKEISSDVISVLERIIEISKLKKELVD